jgi:hypothetical protein
MEDEPSSAGAGKLITEMLPFARAARPTRSGTRERQPGVPMTKICPTRKRRRHSLSARLGCDLADHAGDELGLFAMPVIC